MIEVQIKNRKIGYNHLPYYIAEACNNHQGDLDRALSTVDAAHRVGADAIKFQLRRGPGYLTEENHQEIRKYCGEKYIDYIVTAYDARGVDFAHLLDPEIMKIGSAEWIDKTFVELVISLGKPTFMSTGGGEWEHLRSYEDIFREDTVILHCTSMYPTQPIYADLYLIRYYKIYFEKNLIGFSDHTLGHHITCGAVANNACVIEKHFTLDRTLRGPDQQISLEPFEFQVMIDHCDQVWEASRVKVKTCYKQEKEKLAKWRDSKQEKLL